MQLYTALVHSFYVNLLTSLSFVVVLLAAAASFAISVKCSFVCCVTAIRQTLANGVDPESMLCLAQFTPANTLLAHCVGVPHWGVHLQICNLMEWLAVHISVTRLSIPQMRP